MIVFEAFGAALVIALRVIGAGAAWTVASWSLRIEKRAVLRQGAGALALGLVLNLLPALLLAPLNRWSPTLDWFCWALLLLSGLAWSARKGARLQAAAPQAALMVAVLTLLSGVVLLMPPRSEWLAGGWDPGIYQGNAVRIATDHGIRPRMDTFYAALTAEEITHLSRGSERYREILPSVPVLRDEGTLPLYYFHLTPLCGAWLLRLGGMEVLFQMPVLLGFWMLLVAWALFDRLGAHGWRSAAMMLAWMTSPLWWYHQAIPTTEMLYILLLLGGVHFFLDGYRVPVASGLLFFAATVNHFNFPVVWGLLFCVFAWTGFGVASDGRMLPRVFCCMAAVWVAIAWDLAFAHITVVRLQEKDQILGWVLGPFAVLGLTALVLGWKPPPPRLREWAARVSRRGGMVAGVAILLTPLALCLLMRHEHWYGRIADLPLIGSLSFRMSRFHLFMGIPHTMWAGWGLCLLALDRNADRQPLRILALALGGVFLAFLLNPGIAEIYPWGLRRYLVVGLPFLAAAQGMVLIHCVEAWPRRPVIVRFVTGALLAVALGSSLIHARQAYKMGEYVGLRDLLEEINRELIPGDVVVVDDPLWGTPLLLVYGHDVVNGRFLWDSEDTERRAAILATLKELQVERGRRIVWLTSTNSKLEIYKLDLGDCVPLFEERAFSYQTVIHSKRGSHFSLSENQRVFGLYVCTTTDSRTNHGCQ